MELRPGYQRTAVGLIPADWMVLPLGRRASFRTGPFGSSLHKSDYTSDGIPVVNPTHIVDGVIMPDGDITIGEAAAARLAPFRLQPGNIVMGRRGDMGRCAVVRDDQIGWLCGTGSLIIRCGSDAHPGFVARVLSSPRVVTSLESASVGSTMNNLNQGILSTLLVQFPRLDEQAAISAVLDDVDASAGALTQLIAKKRDLKQAAMQQLLTGQTRLPGFSGEWRVEPLGRLFSFSGGLSASREQLGDSGLCYLHYGDIHKSEKQHVDVAAEGVDIPRLDVPLTTVSESALLDDGDVVFVDASEDEAGTSKHVVIVNPQRIPFVSGLHTIVAKRRGTDLDGVYERYCFLTKNVRDQFRFYAAGTKVMGVNKTTIAKILLRFPPSTDEQRSMGQVLTDMDLEIEGLERRLSKTRDLKQGMMHELLTGRTRLV